MNTFLICTVNLVFFDASVAVVVALVLVIVTFGNYGCFFF